MSSLSGCAASLTAMVMLVGFVHPACGQNQSLKALPLSDLSSFSPSGGNWQVAGDAWTRWDSTALVVEPGTGVLVNLPTEDVRDNLFTSWEHGDLELELEFMLPQGSNSGIYLQGRYELQLLDSWGVTNPRYSDAGGIYRRYDAARSPAEFEGHAPRVNASRAPGLWQQLRIVFQAPRFDSQGRKTDDAEFIEVVLNGVIVQERVRVSGPTRGSAFEDESGHGPLMIQGDHGQVAFRNIRYRHFEPVPPVRLTDARYALYEGEFSSLDEMVAAEPVREGATYGYVWDLFGTYADRLGSTWEGILHVPISGEYDFHLRFNWIDEIPYNEEAVPGHGLVEIDGQTVISHQGGMPTASGSIELDRGEHVLRLSYFKNRRLWRPIVFLDVEGPGLPRQQLNAPRSLPEPEESAPIVPAQVGDEPYVLRSFAIFEGEKRVNVVSVGDPRRVHYMLDLDTGGLLFAWKHAYVDVGGMWDSRGYEQVARPMGQKLVGSDAPALAVLTDPSSPWPETLSDAQFRLLGYRLDEEGRPTFQYSLGAGEVLDRLLPAPDGRSLTRRLSIEGDNEDVWVRVAVGQRIDEVATGEYRVDGRYFVQTPVEGSPLVRTSGGQAELLLRVPDDGAERSASYTMIW